MTRVTILRRGYAIERIVLLRLTVILSWCFEWAATFAHSLVILLLLLIELVESSDSRIVVALALVLLPNFILLSHVQVVKVLSNSLLFSEVFILPSISLSLLPSLVGFHLGL